MWSKNKLKPFLALVEEKKENNPRQSAMVIIAKSEDDAKLCVFEEIEANKHSFESQSGYAVVMLQEIKKGAFTITPKKRGVLTWIW